VSLFSDSSKVMIRRPFCLNAGEPVMRGTQVRRKVLTCASPPGWPLAQGASWPSLHRLGVMNE
jgi:hypothetical protein